MTNSKTRLHNRVTVTANGAATTLRPDSNGRVTAATYRAALRRVGAARAARAEFDYRIERICAADSGELLYVEFPAFRWSC